MSLTRFFSKKAMTVDTETFTGSGACQGQTATVYKNGRTCILHMNIPISRFPTSGGDGYVIGSIPSAIAPANAYGFNVQTNNGGVPKAPAYVVIRADGTVVCVCSGTYESGMTIVGEAVWFTAN